MANRAGVSLLLSFVLACGSAEDSQPTPPTPEQQQAAAQNQLVQGLAVRDIAIFQAVRLPIVTAGERVDTAGAPIVAGRPGVLRVYMEPSADYTVQDVTAILSIKHGDKVLTPRKLTKAISEASSDNKPASVFDFALDATDVTPDLSYSVTLTGATQSGSAPETSPARFPANGSYDALGATASKSLKVVLVPVRYTADSSARLPETSAEQIAIYRDTMRAMYPVADVEVTVREALDWATPIQPNGAGWGNILNAMIRLRQQDRAEDDVYYYGVFMPRTSFRQFCGGGCVTGLSGLVDNAGDAAIRASVGVGFPGEESGETMAHEIGHAHGRPHAPCGGADGPDPSYPRGATYRGGAIGVWGYSIVSKQFIPPTAKDFMGYCQPTWISDYNYTQLFQRVVEVNGVTPSARVVGNLEPGGTFQIASVDGAGAISWEGQTELKKAPLGKQKPVTFAGAAGTKVAGNAHFYPYDHIPGGILMVRDPQMAWSSMTMDGVTAQKK
jgi:hypothetical protein